NGAGAGGRRERRPGVPPDLPDGGQPSGAAERGQGPDRAVRGCGRHRQQHLGAVRRGRLTVDLPREEEGPAGVGVLIGAACGGG
ncbi:acyl carrier protein, partial [Dysosmobacter welbionis]